MIIGSSVTWTWNLASPAAAPAFSVAFTIPATPALLTRMIPFIEKACPGNVQTNG